MAPIALVRVPPEIGPSDRFEVLLAGCVPNLQLDVVVETLDLDRPKLHSDGWVQERFELLLDELHHQTRLSH